MEELKKWKYTILWLVAFAAIVAAHEINPAAFTFANTLCYAYGLMFYTMLYAGALEINERPLFGVSSAGYVIVLALLLMIETPFWTLPLILAILLVMISILGSYVTSKQLDETVLLRNALLITSLIYAVWYIICSAKYILCCS